jgi:two-component system, OmpR family, osmolarity sensor histidine kinase EnvZ
MLRQLFGLNLFWRTFAWLALLLVVVGLAWQLLFRALEAEPRALQAAQQLGDLVLLSRTALADVEPIQRLLVIKSIERSATLHVEVAEAGDRFEPYDVDRFSRSVVDALRVRLGKDTAVARSLNDKPGLWVRFTTGADAYWLRASSDPGNDLPTPRAWWLLIMLAGTLAGSGVIAGLINRPLQELSIAAHKIREGEYDSRLDEHTLTSEVREVNRGFNRMARVLAKLEQDRSVMLAGISHDLRTPLARLRLEAEMSVDDEMARNAMAQDIDQLDAIISKFMDYARPHELTPQAINLAELVDREAQAYRNVPQQIRIQAQIPPDLMVLGDPTELSRVISNLMENARRYGHQPDKAAKVSIGAQVRGKEILLVVRDQGPGVPEALLSELTKPFFRGDAARTAATGSGLGLAIVEKALHRMGGSLEIRNGREGGLMTRIRLQQAV